MPAVPMTVPRLVPRSCSTAPTSACSVVTSTRMTGSASRTPALATTCFRMLAAPATIMESCVPRPILALY